MTVNYYEFHWDITGLYGHKEKNHQCNCEKTINAISSQPDYQFVLSQSFDLDEQTMEALQNFITKLENSGEIRRNGRNSGKLGENEGKR